MINDIKRHYDLLIENGNDPFCDPAPLKAYMDKWDGDLFFEKLDLDKSKTVLDIGIGTGRLAVRTSPLCKELYGIDLSEKTINKAKNNLKNCKNITYILGDFLSYKFKIKFDVIYSSLTFMHIKDKKVAINKVSALLNDGGKFVLSIDKNQNDVLDVGFSKIAVFPDDKSYIRTCIESAGLCILSHSETAMAHIFEAVKDKDFLNNNPKNS